MEKFVEYYNSEINRYGGIEKYVLGKAVEKRLLINRILENSKSGGRILEAGCGSSVNSIFLAQKGLKVFCVDNDRKIIKFAKSNAEYFPERPFFINKDIRNLRYNKDYFDVSFNHGVLEHFGDEEIISMINRLLSFSKKIIFSVPSDFFRPKDAINGDERFMSKEHWEKLISLSNGSLEEIFGLQV